MGQNVIAAYEELARGGRYTLRNHVMLMGSDRALVDAYLARGPRALDRDGRLALRAIKLYVDGALGSRGAALLAPYSDDPTNTGLLRTAQADVQSLCERALKAGFQVCTHAIGDRGNRVVLDAYEAALRTAGASDHRFRIEHAQVLAPSDIPRFAQLGVIPSMQSTHQISDMAWAQARLGPERVRGAYAWRALLDTGVIIPNGTDAPVEAVSTLRTFHAAITRENEANQPPGGWYPQQRMTRAEALQSMTIWAARANFMEHAAGSIAGASTPTSRCSTATGCTSRRKRSWRRACWRPTPAASRSTKRRSQPRRPRCARADGASARAAAALGLILAALLGAAIGFQRQYTQKPAGIRTHALVSVGSCAFAMYSAAYGDSRIAAGVITGIGFLGAGTIVRQGFTTRGLTTAASIWTASAIGMGVGLQHSGWLAGVVVLTLVTLALLLIPDDAIMRMLPHRTTIAIVVEADLDRISLDAVKAELVRCADRVRFRDELQIERLGDTRRASIGYILQLDVKHALTGVFETMSSLEGVLRIAVADEPVAPTS